MLTSFAGQTLREVRSTTVKAKMMAGKTGNRPVLEDGPI
jgi:hypothetical protein